MEEFYVTPKHHRGMQSNMEKLNVIREVERNYTSLMRSEVFALNFICPQGVT